MEAFIIPTISVMTSVIMGVGLYLASSARQRLDQRIQVLEGGIEEVEIRSVAARTRIKNDIDEVENRCIIGHSSIKADLVQSIAAEEQRRVTAMAAMEDRTVRAIDRMKSEMSVMFGTLREDIRQIKV